jgi:putative transposase
MQPRKPIHRKRRKSFNDPGHAHELTFSCYRRWPMLGKDRARAWLIDALANSRRRWNIELWAYVIMPEHVHVLLCPREECYDMALILKALKQPVSRNAVRYLRRHAPDWLAKLRVTQPSGRVQHHFWQPGGGYDRNIVHDKTAWACVDYIHDNPVRRGLVDSSTQWPWSSARWYAGLEGIKLPMDECPPSPPKAGSGH